MPILPVGRREAIQVALLTRLSDTLGILLNGASRRYLTSSDVVQVKQPYMTVLDTGATADRKTLNQPSIWHLKSEVTFYVRDPNDKTQSVESTLHAILDAVDKSLDWKFPEPPSGYDPGTTLGGLVRRCYRSDDQLHHGIDEKQSAMSIFINMEIEEGSL